MFYWSYANNVGSVSLFHNLKFNLPDATYNRVYSTTDEVARTKSRNLNLLPIIVVPRNTSSYIAREQLCKLPIVYHVRSQTPSRNQRFHNSSAKRLIIPRNVSRSSSPAAKDEQKRATTPYELRAHSSSSSPRSTFPL